MMLEIFYFLKRKENFYIVVVMEDQQQNEMESLSSWIGQVKNVRVRFLYFVLDWICYGILIELVEEIIFLFISLF